MTFAGNILAIGHKGSGVERWFRKHHEFSDTEIIAVVTRDGEWHAYVIDDTQRAAFKAWAWGEWTDADGEFDAEIRFDQLSDWEA